MATISDIVARNHEAILARWLEQARRAASARGLDDPALTDLMPRFLASLAAEEEDGGEFVERHFATRLRQGFQLAEIVDELALLRHSIVERSLEEPTAERPGAADVDRLNSRIHRASALVASMFDEHMAKDEQIDKRYVRLLQDVATAALRGGTTALRSGLKDLLDVVVEAMDAQGAAILLRNGHAAPITASTAGAAPIEGYMAELEPRTLAHGAAGGEEPVSLWEVSSVDLAVPESVRRTGIGALLGVRLAAHSGLWGTICLGITEARAFSAREHRRFENLAEHLVAHLETVVLVERLNDTIRALEAERSIREQFVAVLAHDLRGPLAAAKLGADLLSQSPSSLDARRELAVRIGRNLDRLDRMIRDLLDANRIRAGERLPLRLDSCDLAQIAEEVAEELRMLHGDRFVVQAGPRIVGIWSADELRRALWNLATNAVKYGDPDRPITLAVGRTDGKAIASVHNWGPAIAPEDQVHLFDTYARGACALEARAPGWGLGLTLVRGCAEAHGGSVSAASSDAEGTTFTIELPVDARPYQLHPAPGEDSVASVP